jgi:hypothetical protein
MLATNTTADRKANPSSVKPSLKQRKFILPNKTQKNKPKPSPHTTNATTQNSKPPSNKNHKPPSNKNNPSKLNSICTSYRPPRKPSRQILASSSKSQSETIECTAPPNRATTTLAAKSPVCKNKTPSWTLRNGPTIKLRSTYWSAARAHSTAESGKWPN